MPTLGAIPLVGGAGSAGREEPNTYRSLDGGRPKSAKRGAARTALDDHIAVHRSTMFRPCQPAAVVEYCFEVRKPDLVRHSIDHRIATSYDPR